MRPGRADLVEPGLEARELRSRGVACATPDGALRFSPHWPNDPGEIPGVLGAIDGALRALGPRRRVATPG